MGYAPRHAMRRAVETAKRLSWPARTGVAAVAVTGLAAGGFAMAGGAGAATTTICSAPCSWQSLAEPSGQVLDVKSQVAAAGQPVIAWKGTSGDPAEDFTVAKAAGSGTTLSKSYYYEFASNEANGNWQMSDNPISDPAGTETLTSSGVSLTANGGNGQNYGTAEIVVPLGKLSSLFDSSGTYVPPTVQSTGATPYVNFYVDANGDGYPLSFSYNGAVYEGPGGDNLFIPPSTSGGTIDTNGWTQGNNLITNGQTMQEVQADYKNDTATTDPEVWAAIGVQSSDANSVTSTINSVDGGPLVTSTPTTVQGDQIEYTPYTNAAGAKAAGNTAAEAAYNSDSSPAYCVAMADTSGAQAHLAKCATQASASQDFQATPRASGANHDLFELASDTTMALNDAGYGSNGSPIIAYKANPSDWNEAFYPGDALAG